MLAATQRQDFPAPPGATGRARAPDAVFRAAYQELCTRLWLELELIAQSLREPDPTEPTDPDTTASLLRLELVVLVDACRSARWRSMLLAGTHCDRMCGLLTDVLAALYVDTDGLAGGVADAQERLLDELLVEQNSADADHPGTADAPDDVPADPGIEALISVVREHATALACR